MGNLIDVLKRVPVLPLLAALLAASLVACSSRSLNRAPVEDRASRPVVVTTQRRLALTRSHRQARQHRSIYLLHHNRKAGKMRESLAIAPSSRVIPCCVLPLRMASQCGTSRVRARWKTLIVLRWVKCCVCGAARCQRGAGQTCDPAQRGCQCRRAARLGERSGWHTVGACRGGKCNTPGRQSGARQ